MATDAAVEQRHDADGGPAHRMALLAAGEARRSGRGRPVTGVGLDMMISHAAPGHPCSGQTHMIIGSPTTMTMQRQGAPRRG